MKPVILLFVIGFIFPVFTGCDDDAGPATVSNNPPVILNIVVSPDVVLPGHQTALFCRAVDQDLDSLSYTWSSVDTNQLSFSSGGNGSNVTVEAPAMPGMYTVTVTVSDGVNETIGQTTFNSADNGSTGVTTFTLGSSNAHITMVWIPPGSFIMGSFDIGEETLFETTDIISPEALIVRFRDTADTLSAIFKDRFSINSKEMIDEFQDGSPVSDELLESLVDDLNEILKGQSVYNEDLFIDFELSNLITKMIQLDVREHNLIYLNRLLFELVYSVEIARNGIDTNILDLDAADVEFPDHEINIEYGFWIGKFEINQEQWTNVTGTNPSGINGSNHPVERVSWYDVKAFIDSLNSYETDSQWRLPSEAEWEYVCRAGSVSRYPWGLDSLGVQMEENANFGAYNLLGSHEPVGSRIPNSFGVHDILGNVWEWCEDTYHSDYDGAPTDGSAWVHRSRLDRRNRILKGGSWVNLPSEIRSPGRHEAEPELKYFTVGFRLVRDVL